MPRFQIGLDAILMMTFDDQYSLEYLTAAEDAGFDCLWLGDHFFPWHHSFRHSFFVWEVLAAVGARTSRIRFGPDVTVPIGGRYHPAIIAQAAATMDNLFPGRFVLGVGTGEAISEALFFGHWPKWKEREERLIEAVDLIKKLWKEKDYFDFDGKYFKMKNVFCHLKPKTQIPIYFSALGAKSAYQAGRYADRLITIGTVERMRDVIFPRLEEGARSAGRDPKKIEKVVMTSLATGPKEKILLRMRKLMAGATIAEMFNETDPRKIERAGRKLSDKEILRNVSIFHKGEEAIKVLNRYKAIGADQVIIGELNPNPEYAMKVYSNEVIPYFKKHHQSKAR